MIQYVTEGKPFDIGGEDRAHLARVLGRSLEWRADGVVVWSVVGHVRLPSKTTLVIRSAKAPAACVLSWAAYVDPALSDLRNLRLLPDIAADGDVGGAVARAFCTELLNVAGAHGLRRRYRRTTTRGGTLRGSIDFAALARTGGDLARTPCIVWERQPRTTLNQLFSAALEVIQRASALRRFAGPAFLEARALFADVPPRVDPDLLAGRRGLERDELAFAPACSLARMILRGSGLATGVDERGVGFLVRLDALFERAVVRALDDAGLGGFAKHPAPYLQLDGEDLVETGAFELDYFVPVAPMRTSALVVDAKYKWKVDPANLQQMTAYCHLMGTRRAVLVFPSGHTPDVRPYVFRSPTGNVIHVDILELDSTGTSVAAWHTNGRLLSKEVAARCSSSAAGQN